MKGPIIIVNAIVAGVLHKLPIAKKSTVTFNDLHLGQQINSYSLLLISFDFQLSAHIAHINDANINAAKLPSEYNEHF